jgi:putative chitinase
MFTEQLLRDVCRTVNPRRTPLRTYIQAFASSEGQAVLGAWGINTKERLAAFMANVCHETGGLTIVRENMNYRRRRVIDVWSKGRAAKVLAAVRGKHYGTHDWRVGIGDGAYGDRLGNEDDGTDDHDGFNFRGGGPLQATGKGFYRFLERETGLPFTTNPELIEIPEHWPLVAALTWCKHPSAKNLNQFADMGNFKACCLGINYGSPYARATPVGWADRKAWYSAWRQALAELPDSDESETAIPTGVTYRVGMPYSDAVRAAQARLNVLGYADKKLGEDGLYGPRTRSAVQDFETENELVVTGMLSPSTMALLMSDEAKSWPVPAEALEGIEGLRKNGDPEIKAADSDRATAALLTIGGGAAAVKESGILDMLSGAGKAAENAQAALEPLVAVIKFGVENAMPVACIIGAILLYRKYGKAISTRIEKWSRP